MSAEDIARVVADLRARRAVWLLQGQGLSKPRADGTRRPVLPGEHEQWQRWVADQAAIPDAPVIDATAIYDAHEANPTPVRMYEDHPCIAPPWRAATIAYSRQGGNVRVITMSSSENPQQLGNMTDAGGSTRDYETFAAELDANRERTQPGPWATPNEVDWGRVKWIIDGYMWIGGRFEGQRMPTQGPAHHWKFAVYEDGTPADLHWVQFLDDLPEDSAPVQNTQMVLLAVLNFMNCRNVDLVEPRRPNAERKRIARTGVQVQEINVFPVGRSSGSARSDDAAGVPLTSVRGHFASYGPEHGKGLLFGKYSGRFWRPQHARGDSAHGHTSLQKFTLHPDPQEAS